MNRQNILLIGAGELGSRHLQALVKLREPAYITVIDPSVESLETGRLRMREVEGWDRHTVVFQQQIENLTAIDFAVVATSANVRRQVVEQLLAMTKVRFLLLEKVLFQSSRDCVEIGRLLDEKDVRAWVNAPRRMWSGYQVLKTVLEEDRILSFVYSGAGWGLACNSYHMLDLFAWLSTGSIELISSELVESGPLPSKRSGYFELKGTLTGRFDRGTVFMLNDHRGIEKDFDMLIETKKRLLHISEKNSRISLVSGEPLPPQLDALQIKPEYQSNLTNLVAETVLANGQCELTPYLEASELHQKMLDAFAAKFTQSNEGDLICPIT